MKGCAVSILVLVAIAFGVLFFNPTAKGKLVELASTFLRVDPTPHSYERYLNEGFPDPNLRKSWGLSTISQFKSALHDVSLQDLSALPNADTEFGKQSFQQIVKMMNKLSAVPPEAQINFWNQLVEVEELYMRAFSDHRVRYDRELSLIRGLLLQGYATLLPQDEVSFEGKLPPIAGSGNSLSKDDLMQRFQRPNLNQQKAQLREALQHIVEGIGDHVLFRPEARRIFLRYLRDYYPAIRRELRQNIGPVLQRNLSRETDPEAITYYKQIIAN